LDILEASLFRHTADESVIRTRYRGATKDLYFKANKPLWADEFLSLDFVAISLCHYASALGADLHVNGLLSSQQLDRLDEFLQIWSTWRPDLYNRIRISGTAEIEEPLPVNDRAVLAFSGGVDASFSLLAHHDKLLGRLSRKIDLGILVLGWDIRPGDIRGEIIAQDSAEKALADFGADCATIETNWQQDFCPDWFMGHTAAIAGILHTVSAKYSSGVISGDTSYLQEFFIGPYSNSTAVNHLLGSRRFQIIHTGGNHTRIQKTRAILDHAFAGRYLRVCYAENSEGENCGHCRKCVTTQLGIMALGHDPSKLFREPMKAEDLERLDTNRHGVTFLEEVLEILPTNHEMYPALADAVSRGMRLNFPRNKYDPNTEQQTLFADQIHRLELEIAALRNSTSWKITSPIRAIRGFLNRLKL
jgi:hypothetical protein